MSRSERNPPHDVAASVLAIALAVALLPGAAPVAADTPALAPSADQPAFHQDRFTEDRGDVATVGVDVGNRSNVTLRVEPANESASQYTAEIVLYDRNEDGQVAVQLNTYALGHEARPISASGSDIVHVRESASLDHRLRVGEYRLILETGNETVDQSTLVVRPTGPGTLRVLTANGTRPANLSSRAGVEAAIENGIFGDDGRFSAQDTLLIELEASGLSGPLASQRGSNTTATFLNLFDGPDYSLTIQENGSTTGTEEGAVKFTLTPDATTVVADRANDTYYVLLNVARMNASSSELYTNAGVEHADVFDVEVTYPSDSDETRHSLTSRVRFISSVTAETPMTVDAATNQSIEMDSDLTSTRNIRVMLRSDDGIVRVARTVEVEDDGTLVATFDLSTVPPGKTMTLTVDRRDWGVLYAAHDDVHVRSPPTSNTTSTPTPTASPTPTATPSTDRTPTETPGSAPGFGPIATLLALAAAVAVVGRRRRT